MVGSAALEAVVRQNIMVMRVCDGGGHSSPSMRDIREGKSGENMPLKALTHVTYRLCVRVCFHLFRINASVEWLSHTVGLYLTS